ncbi:expressed unknown protein [Seminavis robusta]|uniref:Uncharacterized protein n=1 Tax=Seminavis robusta TaxID=568900 RepID=A0A9N8EH61_9STRA|nr:expressed unknown protein [Seminavis robusta]|eukprot:Sro1074_g238250.1 n/a (337) ;mRNA; r:4134-5144
MSDSKETRKVQFAENNDVFIIREMKDDSFYIESSSQGLDDSNDDDEENDYQSSVVDIRENMRDCIVTWSKTPYWKLLEGAVDDEDGEAKDVQRYITCYARVEVDGDSPRGLERQICRAHHEARKALNESATHAVLENDFRLRYETPNKTDEDIWKEIRHIYKEHSRGSKAFARKMGKADEAAVQRSEMDPALALEQIEDLQERAKRGELRTKRTSDNNTRSGREQNKSSTTTRRRTRSLEHVRRDDNNDLISGSKKDKSKKDRKTPLRMPSLNMYRRSSLKDVTKGEEEGNNAVSDAQDLFLEVDKKGKTKRSSRWRSLKKGISKRVTSNSSQRTQ